MGIIRVSSRSRTASVAGAIAGTYRDNGEANVQAIGAGAVNQAVKAAAIATDFLAEEGKIVVIVPSFVELDIQGRQRTAIHLCVQPRQADSD